MNPQELSKLEEIKIEQDLLLQDISCSQARIAELNTQRQNIIMGW